MDCDFKMRMASKALCQRKTVVISVCKNDTFFQSIRVRRHVKNVCASHVPPGVDTTVYT